MAHGGCGRATAEDMNLEWFHRVGMVNGSFSSWRGLGEQASWGRPAKGVVSRQRVVSLSGLLAGASTRAEQLRGW